MLVLFFLVLLVLLRNLHAGLLVGLHAGRHVRLQRGLGAMVYLVDEMSTKNAQVRPPKSLGCFQSRAADL